MVQLTRIYTGKGDKGQTSLGNGQKVAKNALRVEAYGSIDEANAVLGLARLQIEADLDPVLTRVQNDLFDLGSDLCVPAPGEGEPPLPFEPLRLSEGQADRLLTELERFNASLPPLTSFVLPGGTVASAHLHHARTVIRRAERQVVALAAVEPVTPPVLLYLNRLSDLLFVLARHANGRGSADVLWVPGQNREPPQEEGSD